MTRSIARWALALLAAGCAGAPDRPEPPSGAVDPGVHGLATPGEAPRSASPAADPAAAAIAARGGGVVPPLPASPASPPAPSAPTAEASGTLVMTREHCATLGRKFAELTMAQAGGGAGMDPAAENVGRTFTDRCTRDMVGQTVEAREYQCMLRARAPDELLGCKR